ncbi:MAG: hypothetical protein PVH17_03605 [Anaerolineae bacterium]|jgi:hypothetical protein
MSEGPIRIELFSGKDSPQSLDEPLDLSVRVTNVSADPVWMVGVLPGSEGLRYPRYAVEIEGPSGPVETGLPEGLDYARGLRPEDFVRLAPGESFDPQRGRGFIPVQQLAWFRPTERGKYRLRLWLDTTAEDPREWMGHTFVRDRSKVETLVKQVPRVEVQSNTLEIEFD